MAPDEVTSVLNTAMDDRVGALIVFDDPVLWSHRKQIVELAGKGGLPAMYGYREFVDAGGLISNGRPRCQSRMRLTRMTLHDTSTA